jgi:hypothetical protein
MVPNSADRGVEPQECGPLETLRRIAHLLGTSAAPHDEKTFKMAADAWVAAVDDGSISDWDVTERRRLERTLIEQPGIGVRPPIFHHRISAQHASAIKGHLSRAAEALEPLLESMLATAEESLNLVLMLLLLRSKLKQIDQRRITDLHRKHFKAFPVECLAIPYSVMFHREEYGRNADELAGLVSDEGEAVLDGSWPLTHLLHAYWLSPASFAFLPEDWPATAIRNRIPTLAYEEQELAAARSLALRFNGPAPPELPWSGNLGDLREFDAALRDLAERRASYASPTGKSQQAAARVDSTPHRAVNVAWNLFGAGVPILGSLRRKPRVAICVSGQLRGFRAAFDTWKHALFPGIEPTIFISSWKRIGRASPEPFRYVLPFAGSSFTEAYKAVGTDLGLAEMTERYPSLYEALTKSADTNEAELSRLYGTPHVHLDDEQEAKFAELTNPEKMHLKIEHAFRMAVESREEFDLFVRIRPDKPVRMVGFSWSDMAEATDGLPKLYAENAMGVHYGALEIGDQFAVGSLPAFQIYAETWSRAANFSKFHLRMFHGELTGHVSLAQMCWLHGVEVRRAPVKFGLLQDPEPLPVRVIHAALVRDSVGRMDQIDRRLLLASEIDSRKLR